MDVLYKTIGNANTGQNGCKRKVKMFITLTPGGSLAQFETLFLG